MGVQSHFDAIAVQTVTLLAMHIQVNKKLQNEIQGGGGAGGGGGLQKHSTEI